MDGRTDERDRGIKMSVQSGRRVVPRLLLHGKRLEQLRIVSLFNSTLSNISDSSRPSIISHLAHPFLSLSFASSISALLQLQLGHHGNMTCSRGRDDPPPGTVILLTLLNETSAMSSAQRSGSRTFTTKSLASSLRYVSVIPDRWVNEKGCSIKGMREEGRTSR